MKTMTYFNTHTEQFEAVPVWSAFTMHGEQWVVHRRPGIEETWIVSHFETGFALPCVCAATTRAGAVNLAWRYLEYRTEAAVQACVAAARGRIARLRENVRKQRELEAE